jgi:ATP-binding cassette subfamily C (CFTR/MRP) protein 1
MKFQFSNPFNPPPAPPAFGSGKILPEESSPLVLNSFVFRHKPESILIVCVAVTRFLSRLIFQWLSPFLEVGFSRPLEPTGMSEPNPNTCQSSTLLIMTILADLWELPQPQLTSSITDKTELNFYSRCPPEKRPRFMNKESQNTISQTPLVSASKDTVGDAENEKQEFEPADMDKVQSAIIFDDSI